MDQQLTYLKKEEDKKHRAREIVQYMKDMRLAFRTHMEKAGYGGACL